MNSSFKKYRTFYIAHFNCQFLYVYVISDPFKWTKRQAQNWLCWLREVNDLDEIDITHFNFDGVGLCGLSQDSVRI